jgi:hypothetical protein
MLSPKELSAVRREWSRAINRWGLFDRVGPAESFRAACDSLIPEHAPFEVYRLRRVNARPPVTPTIPTPA